MSPRLAAVLEKRVRGVDFGQVTLFLVGEVEVVDGESDHGEGVGRGSKGGLEGGDLIGEVVSLSFVLPID